MATLGRDEDSIEDTSESSKPEDLKSEPDSEFPETVQFEGTAYTSLKQVHISAFLLVLAGAIVAFFNPLVGFPLLIVFLLLVLGVEAWMIRKSKKHLRLTLHLREDPVEATQGSFKVGKIENGTIDPDMDNPNELGFRPAPNRDLIVWTFDSVQEKEIVLKRLLKYLPLDNITTEIAEKSKE